MTLLKRLSDSLWSLVSSPANTPKNQTRQVSQTAPPVPRFKKPALADRRLSLDDFVRARRSMSPDQRVAAWKLASDVSSPVVGGKRQRDPSASPSGKPRRRRLHVDDQDDLLEADECMQGDSIGRANGSNGEVNGDSQSGSDVESGGDEIGRGEEFELPAFSAPIPPPIYSPSTRARRASPFLPRRRTDGVDVDSTRVISEAEYTGDSPKRKRILTRPEANEVRGISVPDLRAAGWDDDHIALRKKIAMRGYEPLLPIYHKFEFRWLPDELFAAGNNAFLNSCAGNNFHASKALTALFEIGARTRECATSACTSTRPDQRLRSKIEEYVKWANVDSGLHLATAIPLFVIVNQRAGFPAVEMKAQARRQLHDIALRYQSAFVASGANVLSSSPSPRSRHHPLPTLYAFVASSTILSLNAWRPSDPDMDLKPVVYFDMAQSDYDVWNALAIAIAIVHMRNMQLAIAAETGVGMRPDGWDSEDDDPDR